MNKIKLARIDSRLSHGKMVSYWTDFIKATTLLIVNERLSKDDFEQSLMNLTIPENIKRAYLKPEDVYDYLLENEDEDVFLLVESPADLEKIINRNVEIEKVNIGIIHLQKGKKLLTEEVAVDSKDLEIFSKLVEKNIEVFVQLTPFSQKRDLSEFFDEK